MDQMSNLPSAHLSKELITLGVPRLWQELYSLRHLLPIKSEAEYPFSVDEAAELAIYLIKKKAINPSRILADDLEWGDHICLFYKTKNEALRKLAPFFAKGLSGNDKCLWMTSPRLSGEEARAALTEMVGDLDPFILSGQLEIVDYRDMYLSNDGNFKSPDELLSLWGKKASDAIEKGYDGLRATGDPASFHNLTDWDTFIDFESKVQQAIGTINMIAICTYHIHSCHDEHLSGILEAHGSAICERSSQWHTLHSQETNLAEGMKTALRSLRQLRH